ncbi:universal stress protein [Candidatus Solirubrobacter pratensis]|jgi:nucleotide-binding universal stress UspA family protein|uniref:universal stress protein n=1 Tax=Candidatus Solirubrobacter pratensis TaxID=1298857 RepID=UPI0004000683|nr:universal stress protein [Candidatus Solirubrobacter pratensis]
MRILAWITAVGWESCVDALAGLPAREITLLHVADPIVHGAGLLGRHPPPDHYGQLAVLAANELLDAAAERLGATPATVHRIAATGRPEEIVTGACSGADVLVLARSGRRPGPHSLEHATRFIVDHAPCTVVLTWP